MILFLISFELFKMRHAFVASLFVFLLISCGKEKTVTPQEATLVKEEVPSTKIIEKDGVTLEIYDFEAFHEHLKKKDGKTYVVNFWATWCKPCVKELPYFEELNKEYKEKGVEVLLVSLDMPSMLEKQLIPFIQKKELRSKVMVLDDVKSHLWIPKVDEAWSGAIPATVIYKKDERAFYEQSFTYTELEDELLKILEL